MIRSNYRLRAGLTVIETTIVLVVMTGLFLVLKGMIDRFSTFKSTQDEATLLKESLQFCRTAAIRSNDTIYVDFNLDDETYRGYRKLRGEEEVKQKDLIKERNLSSGNSIIAMHIGSSNRLTSGKVTIKFYPDGSSDELAIFLGPDPEIKNTILFSRFGKAEVAKGEVESTREDPTFKENLEDW